MFVAGWEISHKHRYYIRNDLVLRKVKNRQQEDEKGKEYIC